MSAGRQVTEQKITVEACDSEEGERKHGEGESRGREKVETQLRNER